MTEITFHFNVPDKLDYVCRMLRKIRQFDRLAVVTGDADFLQTLDGALWKLDSQAFLGHGTDTSTAAVRRHSPVILSTLLDDAPHSQVLVNVGQDVPAGFSRFVRLNEIIGLDEQDRSQGRLRWKYYAGRGYTLKKHDFAAQKAA